jgi:HD-GYP domain-containing protein (c-di-GMP phosphodiesterase class II)
MSNIEPSALPARECLLSDKQEHIRNRVKETLPESFGITMKAPEREINLGEVYNLSIRRGTLTEEDRYAIQEHMVSTIKMLNSLPFPPELENVPRYASTHHEKMDGTGYPRGYDYSQLSLPERVLMIADIFEALTANDRPYKQAKSLEEAKTIIGYMATDNHLDAHLVEYFFDSGVPEHYLQRQRTRNKPA